MLKTLPSQHILKETLDYNPETGSLTWRERANMNGFWPEMVGQEAFTVVSPKGYFYGKLFKKSVRKHRVIWKWMTGEDPEIVDHEDGNPQNNRWNNLTDVEIVRSNRNRATPKNNTSGHIGVRLTKHGRYRACIGNKGKWVCLGFYSTFEEAVKVRQQAEIDLGYHVNHGREKVMLDRENLV